MERFEPVGPRSGDDATFEAVDEAIAALGFARGLWMPDPRVMIHLVASIVDQAQRCLPELIADARDDGCGWDEIAVLLGVGVQEARRRFDIDSSPAAERRWMLDVEAVTARTSW